MASPSEVAVRLRGTFATRERVKPRDLVIFTRQLSAMVHAGLPLTQALDTLSGPSSGRPLRKVAGDVLREVEGGAILSGTLRRHPTVFSRLYVNMVEAGELGGRLDVVLGRLAAFLEKNENIRRKVKGALLYPALVLAVSVAVIATLLLFVIPAFESVFAGFDAALPLPTRMAIALSRWAGSGWWAALVAIGAGWLALRLWLGTDAGRLRFDTLTLRLPVLGGLTHRAAVSRSMRTLGTLLSSGVPILEGLDVTARTAGNRVIHDAILACRASIAGGESVAGPLRASGAFPPMVSQMIHVGEETGDLDGMLARIADYCDDEVDAAADGLLRVLEPALIVILGGLVGGIIVAMYLPIFNLVDAVR